MKTQTNNPDRREFLKLSSITAAKAALTLGGLGMLGERVAYGANAENIEQDYDFLMPRVKFPSDGRVQAPWNVYPGADRNLLIEFRRVVRCKIKLPTNCHNTNPLRGREDMFNAIVDLTDLKEMRKFPFLFMTGEGHYNLPESKRNNLRQYIQQGGFMLMDDCVYMNGGDYFYKSTYKILEEVFGPSSVVRIPNSHEIFHNVYDLGEIGLPFVQGQNHGARGVFVGNRLAIFLSSTDIHCGYNGHFPKKSRQYQQSIQRGTNILMYAMSH